MKLRYTTRNQRKQRKFSYPLLWVKASTKPRTGMMKVSHTWLMNIIPKLHHMHIILQDLMQFQWVIWHWKSMMLQLSNKNATIWLKPLNIVIKFLNIIQRKKILLILCHKKCMGTIIIIITKDILIQQKILTLRLFLMSWEIMHGPMIITMLPMI